MWLVRGSGDSLVLVNEQPGRPGARLRLTVENGELQMEQGDASTIRASQDSDGVVHFSALFGVVTLLAGPYVVVVTSTAVVGKAPQDQDIYRVEKVAMLPVSLNLHKKLLPRMRKDEKRYLAMLEKVFKTRSFYFSPNYDITLSQQRIAELSQLSEDDKRGGGSSGGGGAAVASISSQWRRADIRFFWNRNWLSAFTEARLDDWITVMMCGFVDIQDHVEIASHEFRMLLITRRSIERQGTRFNVRGVDETGSVANYAESEQIAVFPGGHVTSYVQIRGSIPLFWQQLATVKYTPAVELTGDEEAQAAAFARHFTRQVGLYGDVVIVNLIDKKSDQLGLGTLYQQYCERINHPQVRYIWFDFHAECAKMKWHNLSKLVDIVGDDFQKIGYFSADDRGQIVSVQKGVIRTNCIDNLDRTNVVQSIFARRSVLQQFQKISQNVLDSPFVRFEYVFKNTWADNADLVSNMYTGTGALKTDFTRTGKRTIAGALQDGWNSLTRYYLNNFKDGANQDAVDLFLGKFEPALSYVRGQEDRYFSPFSGGGLFSRNSPVLLIRLLLMLLTLVVTLLTKCSLKKFNGRNFVDQPSFLVHARNPVYHELFDKKLQKKAKEKLKKSKGH